MPEAYRKCRANRKYMVSRKLLGVKEKSKQTHRPLFVPKQCSQGWGNEDRGSREGKFRSAYREIGVPRLARNRLEKVLRETKISLRTLGKWVEMRYNAKHHLEESGAV